MLIEKTLLKLSLVLSMFYLIWSSDRVLALPNERVSTPSRPITSGQQVSRHLSSRGTPSHLGEAASPLHLQRIPRNRREVISPTSSRKTPNHHRGVIDQSLSPRGVPGSLPPRGAPGQRRSGGLR